MRVLVTGGAGLIGSNLVKQLLENGVDVNVLHLPGDDLRNLQGLDVQLFEGSVLDIDSLKRAISRCSRVYHLAAIYALWLPRMELMREVNVEGTRNVMQLCLDMEIEKVVYCSSIACFGGQGLDKDATENSPFALDECGDLYSMTKHEAHKLVMGFFSNGLNVTIVAPCGPVGPGDYGPTPTGRAILSAVNLPLVVVLKNITNLGDVRDIAYGHILAMERGEPGRTYLLGNCNCDFREMTLKGLEIIGIKKPVLSWIPHFVLKVMAHVMLAWANHVSGKPPLLTPAILKTMDLGLRADCSRAIEELGLPVRPIEESIRDSLIWFAENGFIRSRRIAKKLIKMKYELNEDECEISGSAVASGKGCS